MTTQTGKATFDLDTLEREGRPDPFVVTLGGQNYEMADPKDYDYRDLLNAYHAVNAGEPGKAVDLLVHPDQREAFFANQLPSWKLEALFRRYNEHFGLPSPGEANASPTS